MSKMKNYMAYLQLLLCGGLISMAMADKNSLIYDLIPINYEITITPRISKSNVHNFYGEAIITAKINDKDIRNIVFRSTNLAIINIVFNMLMPHDSAKFGHVYRYKPLSYVYDTEEGKMKLSFDEEIEPGVYLVTMKFIGGEDKYKSAAIFRTTYTTEDAIHYFAVPSHKRVFTAMGLFPYWNESSRNNNFTVNVNYRHYGEKSFYESVTFRVEHGMIWTHLEKDFDETYLIGIIVSDLKHFQAREKNLDINLWCRPNIEEYLLFAWDYIQQFSRYMQRTLSGIFDNTTLEWRRIVNHIAIPKLSQEAELKEFSQTDRLIIYRESDIMDNAPENHVHRARKKRLIGYKILSDILGDVSYWLNSGLGAFLETYILNEESKMLYHKYIVQDYYESLYLEYEFDMFTGTLNDRITPLTHARYIRVPFLLRMLESLVTPKVFQKGVCNYIKLHAPALPKNPKHLWNAINDALREQFSKNEINITNIMNSGLYQLSYPILNVTRQDDGWIYVSIENIHATNDYILPVTYTSQKTIDFLNTSFKSVLWLNHTHIYSPKPLKKVNDDGWIIFNLQQCGYYRVNYDDSNWQKIIRYLNTEPPGFNLIPELNRAQMIDDAFHFMLRNLITSTTFWGLTQHLKQEIYITVWYPMFKGLEYLSIIFQHSTEQIESIKMKILPMLESVLERITYHDQKGHENTEFLRQEAARWACFFNSSACKQAAMYLYNRTSIDPVHYQLMPYWKRWMYCNVFKMADQNIWIREFTKHVKGNDKIILNCLPHTENLRLIFYYTRTLPHANYSGIVNIENKSRLLILISTIRRHARDVKLLYTIVSNIGNYMIRNYNKINLAAMIVGIINHADDFHPIISYVKEKLGDDSLLHYVENKIDERTQQIQDQLKFIEKLLRF